MIERTHFRCHAYGLLSVAQCRANRKPVRMATGAVVGAVTGRLRPLACGDCVQAAGVERGTESTLATLEELEARAQARPPARASARSLPPDSPMAGVGLRPERPLPRVKTIPHAAPEPPLVSAVQGAGDGSGNRRVVRLLRDLAARRIGLPDAVRRARRLLKALGRDVPCDTWEML